MSPNQSFWKTAPDWIRRLLLGKADADNRLARLDSDLQVGQPNVGDRELFNQLVDQIFEQRRFSNNGPLVRALESKICEYLDVQHCILVCNATVGLQIACHALELTGEVIMPAYTFVATPHAVQWQGLRPVFVDVDPASHTIQVDQLEARITDQTSAVLGVHLWGNPCNTTAIESLASKYGLATIYDAAHAFGCRHERQMIGNFGDCEVFSFHATKFFNTFEGGAITTNDAALAGKIRRIRNFGFSETDRATHLGTNGKMPEICAAMGLACFESLDEILAANRSNYEIYREFLHATPGIRLLDYEHHEGTNWQYVVVEIDDEFPLSRDELIEHFKTKGVRAKRYFYPGCHRMEPYNSAYPRQRERLPNTDTLCSRVICLPTGTAVSTPDVHRVCQTIAHAKPTSETSETHLE